jgi:hypothetical protein
MLGLTIRLDSSHVTSSISKIIAGSEMKNPFDLMISYLWWAPYHVNRVQHDVGRPVLRLLVESSYLSQLS